MRVLTIASATLLVLGCAPSAPEAAPGPIPELVGRTPGAPTDCVRIEPNASLRLTDQHRLIYGSGATLWLNANECPGVSDNDILVLEPSASQHCRGDIVKTIDRISHIPGPVCVLGDFTPYRRPPR